MNKIKFSTFQLLDHLDEELRLIKNGQTDSI